MRRHQYLEFFWVFLFLFTAQETSHANEIIVIDNITVVSSHQTRNSLRSIEIIGGEISRITTTPIEYDQKVVRISGEGKFIVAGIMDSHAHVSAIPGMGFGVDPIALKNKRLVSQYYHQQPRSFLYHGVTQILDPNPGINWNKFLSAKLHPDYFRCEVITSINSFPYIEKKVGKSRSMYTYLVKDSALPMTVHSPEKLVLEIKKSGAACIKLYFENGYGESNQWPLLQTDTLFRIKQAAMKQGLPIVAHANSLDMYQAALAADVDILAHSMWNWGKYQNEKQLTPEIKKVLDQIVENKVGLMPTFGVISGLGELMLPNSNENPKFKNIVPPELLDWYKTEQADWFKEEMRGGFDNIPDEIISRIFLKGRIDKANLILRYIANKNHLLLVASDFPGSPSYTNQPGMTTKTEMKLMSQAGIGLSKILAAATINNARQFNIDKKYGTVEVGKIANLLILTMDPLKSFEAWDSIDKVILHGKIIDRESLLTK